MFPTFLSLTVLLSLLVHVAFASLSFTTDISMTQVRWQRASRADTEKIPFYDSVPPQR
jgi:hypothetical protein